MRRKEYGVGTGASNRTLRVTQQRGLCCEGPRNEKRGYDECAGHATNVAVAAVPSKGQRFACDQRSSTISLGMTDEERVRIDKWLWAARFFKTRSLASEAVAGGKVEVNGERAKPAKLVRPGDEVRLRAGPYEYVLMVRNLAERRGSATVAATLYEERPESRAERERVAGQLRLGAAAWTYEEKGRPTKRDRRALEKFRRRR